MVIFKSCVEGFAGFLRGEVGFTIRSLLLYYICNSSMVTNRKIYKSDFLIISMELDDSYNIAGQRASITSTLSYLDPSQHPYKEYNDHIIAYNSSLQNKLARDFDKLFPNSEGFVIGATGSDGRFEKGPASLIELLVFEDILGSSQDATQSLKHYMVAHKDYFFDNLEVKLVGAGKLSECVIHGGTPSEVRLISPNRIFDSHLLYGSRGLHRKVKEALGSELNSEDGRSIVDRIKDKVREHRKITLNGTQRYKGSSLVHYEPDRGIAHYNPEENLYSFKQGPLRAVQYALVRDIIKKIKEDPSFEFPVLPTNTVCKLRYLEVEGQTALSSTQVTDLSDCYKYFLHLYHLAQNAYQKDSVSETVFDARDVKERCKAVDSICTSSIIK